MRAAPCPHASVCARAGDMEELRRLEKEKAIEPDYEVDAFMKAMCRPPKRESIATDYALHYLGLDVSASLMMCTIYGADMAA